MLFSYDAINSYLFLFSLITKISFMLSILFFSFFYFCYLQTRACARLRSNNGLMVSQHYGFIIGILFNQPIKKLSV